MFASRNQGLMAIFVLVALAATETNAQQAPAHVVPVEKVIETTPPPADSISDSANKQRVLRQRELAAKQAAAAPAQQTVPGIQVNAIPSGADKQSGKTPDKPENDMILTEVLRSSLKSVAGISIMGTVRYVVAGDDLGNGWTVTEVDRFKVTLTEVQPKGKAAKGATGKKTRTLLLGAPRQLDAGAQGMPSAANGMRL